MSRTAEELSAINQLNDAIRHSPRALSAVSWGAVFAGAVGAASLSLILLFLGSGLGLSSVSPWAQDGVGAATFGVSAILWISFTQLAASGVGGYLAGRLRSRWLGAPEDEVYFRDTAHGFLAWGVATLLTAALLSSVIGSTLRGGSEVLASAAGGAVSAAAISDKHTNKDSEASNGYFIDSMFRSNASKKPDADESSAATLAEAGRIFSNSASTGVLPADDHAYLTQLVVQHTDLSQAEAQKRVSEAQAKMLQAKTAAKEAVDKARKASAYAALWFFISLLLGAFVASYLATFGGRLRDK
ncbi:MAG: hypothetical protein V4607_13635 [Pseudomonadota bacterium]